MRNRRGASRPPERLRKPRRDQTLARVHDGPQPADHLSRGTVPASRRPDVLRRRAPIPKANGASRASRGPTRTTCRGRLWWRARLRSAVCGSPGWRLPAPCSSSRTRRHSALLGAASGGDQAASLVADLAVLESLVGIEPTFFDYAGDVDVAGVSATTAFIEAARLAGLTAQPATPLCAGGGRCSQARGGGRFGRRARTQRRCHRGGGSSRIAGRRRGTASWRVARSAGAHRSHEVRRHFICPAGSATHDIREHRDYAQRRSSASARRCPIPAEVATRPRPPRVMSPACNRNGSTTSSIVRRSSARFA